MKKLLPALLFTVLSAACSSSFVTDKTPQTQNGRLYSCMLDSFHRLKNDGALAQTPDERNLAREIQQKCARRLNMPATAFNAEQGINIGISMIRSIR